MPVIAWVVLVAAAVLEVVGDALVRRGLRSGGVAFCVAGFVALGCYGLVVNGVRWDFSRLLGVYVAVFAVVSVGAARLVFKETDPWTTWAGVAVIASGGLIIHLGGWR